MLKMQVARLVAVGAVASLTLGGCASAPDGHLPPASFVSMQEGPGEEFASGNRAKLIRFDKRKGKQTEYGVRLNDLLKKGDTSANVMLQPGDVIIIPESMF